MLVCIVKGKNMEEKKADNRQITVKEKVNKIDDKLDTEKRKLQKLDDMQEELISLNKNLTKCIDSLSKSISGPITKNVFNDMHNSNRLFYIKTSNIIDEEATSSKRNINKLYQEKDEIIKEERNNIEDKKEE